MLYDVISNEHPTCLVLLNDARQIINRHGSLGDLKDCVREVLFSGELQAILTTAVQQILNDPAANPSLMQQENIVLCSDFDGLLLALGKTSFRDSSPIYTSSSDALIGAASPSGFSYQRYTIGQGYDNVVFDPNVKIVASEPDFCSFGDAVLFSQGAASEYRDNGSLVLKVINQRSSESMMWEFDRVTYRACRAYAADAGGTTLRYLVRFLSEFGNEASVGAIKRLLSHRYHYVRWDAVKALGMLDADELHRVLQMTRDDPHPHIRKASEKMLEQLGR